jgi:hypothetical protein
MLLHERGFSNVQEKPLSVLCHIELLAMVGAYLTKLSASNQTLPLAFL